MVKGYLSLVIESSAVLDAVQDASRRRGRCRKRHPGQPSARGALPAAGRDEGMAACGRTKGWAKKGRKKESATTANFFA